MATLAIYPKKPEKNPTFYMANHGAQAEKCMAALAALAAFGKNPEKIAKTHPTPWRSSYFFRILRHTPYANTAKQAQAPKSSLVPSCLGG